MTETKTTSLKSLVAADPDAPTWWRLIQLSYLCLAAGLVLLNLSSVINSGTIVSVGGALISLLFSVGLLGVSFGLVVAGLRDSGLQQAVRVACVVVSMQIFLAVAIWTLPFSLFSRFR